MPTVVDLFSGAGLLSAGFIAGGFKVTEAFDVDASAVASYRRNVGEHIVQKSVLLARPTGRADVVVAGPPCQGFSTLGRRDPTDVRNSLCLVVPNWAQATNAKIAVIENVPTFVGSPQWNKLVARFRKLGFEIETWDLDANDFGVAQRRRRSFTIASRVGPVGGPKRRNRGLTVRDAFWGLGSKKWKSDPLHYWPVPQGIAAQRIRIVPENGDKRDLLRLRPDLCPPSWGAVGCAATDVWGRMDFDEPANTLRCTFQNPSKGRYLHPEENRAISLREGARLQGIPDHWILEGRPYPVARQIGNGVPIPLAKAVALRVREALR